MGKLAHKVKGLDMHPHGLSSILRNSHGWKRDLLLTNYPLTSTVANAVWCVCLCMCV